MKTFKVIAHYVSYGARTAPEEKFKAWEIKAKDRKSAEAEVREKSRIYWDLRPSEEVYVKISFE